MRVSSISLAITAPRRAGAGGPLPLMITFSTLETLFDGDPYNQVVARARGVGGDGNYSYSKVSGSAELTINGSTGDITFNGTANIGSPASATFRVADTGPDPDAQALYTTVVVYAPLTGLVFTPENPTTTAFDPTPELVTTVTAVGGTPPWTYTIEEMEEL